MKQKLKKIVKECNNKPTKSRDSQSIKMSDYIFEEYFRKFQIIVTLL